MSENSEFPVVPSMNGTDIGYKVQVKCTAWSPVSIGDMVLDDHWRELRIVRSSVGVPMYREYDYHLPATGCMTLAAAQALRWWFLAEVEVHHPGKTVGMETRLVRCKIEYSFKGEALEVVGDEAR